MTVPEQGKRPRQCVRCGLQFERLADETHRICQDCHDYVPDLHADPNRQRTYDMAAELTHLRAAFNEIEPLLRWSHDKHARLALAVLERVAAPMRPR